MQLQSISILLRTFMYKLYVSYKIRITTYTPFKYTYMHFMVSKHNLASASPCQTSTTVNANRVFSRKMFPDAQQWFSNKKRHITIVRLNISATCSDWTDVVGDVVLGSPLFGEVYRRLTRHTGLRAIFDLEVAKEDIKREQASVEVLEALLVRLQEVDDVP